MLLHKVKDYQGNVIARDRDNNLLLTVDNGCSMLYKKYGDSYFHIITSPRICNNIPQMLDMFTAHVNDKRKELSVTEEKLLQNMEDIKEEIAQLDEHIKIVISH